MFCINLLYLLLVIVIHVLWTKINACDWSKWHHAKKSSIELTMPTQQVTAENVMFDLKLIELEPSSVCINKFLFDCIHCFWKKVFTLTVNKLIPVVIPENLDWKQLKTRQVAVYLALQYRLREYSTHVYYHLANNVELQHYATCALSVSNIMLNISRIIAPILYVHDQTSHTKRILGMSTNPGNDSGHPKLCRLSCTLSTSTSKLSLFCLLSHAKPFTQKCGYISLVYALGHHRFTSVVSRMVEIGPGMWPKGHFALTTKMIHFDYL